MKKTPYSRRQALYGLAAAGCCSLPWMPAFGASRRSLDVQQLTSRLTLITGAGGNVVLFQGDEFSTLVDTGSRGRANDLNATVNKIAGSKSVTGIFNTHWHAGHTGGNEVFKAQGAEILAHENTRLWMSADFEVEWRDTRHTARPASALPDTTFYESGEKSLGGETVQYHHFPRAHTDGDLVLFFPDSNVMVTGGLMTDGAYPICDIATGGWIGELIPANAAMLELANDDTIIVPDSGAPRTRSDLQAQYAMLGDLYEKMKTLSQQGLNGQNMLDAGVTANYDAQWGDPTRFVLETYMGMALHTYDMGGFI